MTPAGRGCVFTHRTRRLAAAGMRFTHEDGGRWMTWAEVRRRYGSLAADDQHAYAYELLCDELVESRWDDVRERWWGQTCTDGWREWAAVLQQVGAEPPAAHTTVVAARRTAACLGGWELLLRWKTGGWTDSWELESNMRGDGWRGTKAERARIERLKLDAAPDSLHARLTDSNGKWRAQRGRTYAMTASEVRQAVEGELSDPSARRAVRALWRVFLAHAREINGREVTQNLDETPRVHAAPVHDPTRTMYEGRETAVVEEGVRSRVRRPALAQAADERSGQWGVTMEQVRLRLDAQQRLDEADDERRMVPPGGAHAAYA